MGGISSAVPTLARASKRRASSGGALLGHAEARPCCSCGAATSSSRLARRARTTAVRSPRGHRRRHGALSVAPRLLQPAHGRGAAGARAHPVACWDVERRGDQLVVTRKDRARSAAPIRRVAHARPSSRASSSSARAPRGNAAAEMLRRTATTARSRWSTTTTVPVRPAQPVQGLSRRQRARGVDSAAARRILRASTASTRARPRRRDRRRAANGRASTGATPLVRRAAARHRRRAGRLDYAGRRPAARPLPAHARRQPRDHRAAKTAKRAVVIGAELHRPRGGRVAARAQLECTSSRPRASRSSA